MIMSENITRCQWCDDSEIYKSYHDNEWGKPTHDDRELFELLVLESFQAGLSWITILKKRENFKLAFDNFDVNKVALYDENKINELMQNEKIIRNRRKIEAAINNAKLFIELQNQYGSFDNFIWSYVNHEPILSDYDQLSDIPTSTPLAEKICADLKKLGFKFLGKTIIYSFMQSTGMVNDHTTSCYLHHSKKDVIK